MHDDLPPPLRFNELPDLKPFREVQKLEKSQTITWDAKRDIVNNGINMNKR